jgi:hypothetical protein
MSTYRGKVTDRRVIDPADDRRLLCCWLDCEQYGVESHKAREYLGFDPRTGGPIFTWYVFCCDRHKQYFAHSTVHNKNLPPGFRLAVV